MSEFLCGHYICNWYIYFVEFVGRRYFDMYIYGAEAQLLYNFIISDYQNFSE